MTSQALAAGRDSRITLVGVVGFALALAAASHVAIPIPGTPVPITLQPLAVVLAGFWLGPVAGAASMVLYLALGAAGLPVFAPVGAPGVARLVGPTGGYLLAYPVAAWVAGALARTAPSYAGRCVAAVGGIAVLYAGGLAQLVFLTGSVERAVVIGILPFVPLDIAKALVAGWLAPRRTASDRG